ncbi:DUF6802 family protein, partial [Pseudonocardia sp. KRD291]|uniref:DUF6802 family protein n=1 Tax=Pseudonocardia sp. KRD291 TaxID=2792007 RepID=UPI001C5C28EC|nr:hypothetical protein [Pseudonocardia sp. KRD291]
MHVADWTGRPPGLPDPDPAEMDSAGLFDVGNAPGRVPVGTADVDADGDGTPDTVVVATGDVLSLFTDLDGDGLADQELRLGTTPDDPAADEDP